MSFSSTSKIRYTAVILVAVTLLLAGKAAADQSTAGVDIHVNGKTIIDITPNNASFTGDPGSETDAWTNFTLENMGSNTINDVYANVTQPSTNPFGTGDASNYDAGNMVALGNETSSGTPFVDRRDYNETLPDYVELHDSCEEMNASGRIRMDNEEFFYCADTADLGTIYISDSPHNETHTGDVDLSNNGGQGLSDAGGDYMAADVTIPTQEGPGDYCLALHKNGDHVRILKWNTGLDDGACTNDQPLLGDDFNPGDKQGLEIKARIPYGTLSGDLQTGVLTIVAN